MEALLLATTNVGKVREIRRVLGDLPLSLVTLEGFDIDPPDETGRTFAENAVLKARYYAVATGLPTVAEDSGLAIDALGGRPGVASARYPGETYADKFANLYRELAPHARPWTARFVCALAFVQAEGPATSPDFACQTAVEGDIAPSPRGTHGFGYDPIFFFPPYGRTLGEVTDEEKLAVSHRGKAFAEFRAWLRRELAA
jgi:XTP/dITP diphosphohydrolase